MSTILAQVNVIWRQNKFVGDDPRVNTAVVNCEQIDSFSPRQCWLLRTLDGRSPDILYQLTFDSDQNDSNTLQGWWIEENGEGMMIDISVFGTLRDYCRQCCNSSPVPVIATHYNGTYPSFAENSPTIYCLERQVAKADLTALQQIVMDYTGQLENITVIGFEGGVLTVQGTSYSVPQPIKSYYSPAIDVITAGACA